MQAILVYFPLIAILIYFGSAAGLVLLNALRPRFAYPWLVAAFGALLSWGLLLVVRIQVPSLIPLGNWENGSPSGSPVLLLDGFSWLFAIALATLGLAVVLTDIARVKEANWRSWASSLVMVALGIVAVMAGNQLTLLLAWAAIDLMEIILWMSSVYESKTRQRIVLAFSFRAIGIMLTFWPGNDPFVFLLAVLIRLVVLPVHLPEMEQAKLRRGLGTVLRLVPPVASLVFMVRIAAVGLPTASSNLWLSLVLIIAFLASVSWVNAKDELDGRPYWVLGMSLLALASAIRNQPAASMVWGISMVIGGGFLFLYSARARLLNILTVITVIGISTLPYSPSWDAGRLFTGPLYSWQLLLLIPQAILLAGYIRNVFRPGMKPEVTEKMMWVIYPWGLFLLPLTQYLIAYWKWQDILQLGTGYQYPGARNPIETWSGMAVIGLIIIVYSALRIIPSRIKISLQNLKVSPLMNWLVLAFLWVFRLIGDSVGLVSELVEGDGGILWTLLLLTLLLTFFSQGGFGI
jgi:hypothetical protein